MKLIITQSNLTLRGGAERVLLKIAQHYDATIYTTEYDRKGTFEEFGGLDVRVIGKRNGMLPYGRISQGLSMGLGFYNLKIDEDYDVINAHIAPSHWVRKNNERVLWYCHTPLREVYDLYGYRLSMRKTWQKPVYMLGAAMVRRMDQSIVKDIRHIIANSSNTQSRIEKYYGRKDSIVLNGGVDRQRYSNMGDDRYFLYPSRFSPNKRQEYAISAFERFSARNKGYKLIMCGSVSKDSMYRDYYHRIERLAKRTRWVELRTDVDDKELARLYGRSTAVLFTAINEDYGLVPIESMASGKPIIAVNEGGMRETVVDGETGFLVESPSEMAEKMEFVAKNAAAAERMGKNGIDRVRKHYSWESFFRAFDRELRKTMKD